MSTASAGSGPTTSQVKSVPSAVLVLRARVRAASVSSSTSPRASLQVQTTTAFVVMVGFSLLAFEKLAFGPGRLGEQLVLAQSRHEAVDAELHAALRGAGIAIAAVPTSELAAEARAPSITVFEGRWAGAPGS